MKKLIKQNSIAMDSIYSMANISPKLTGLNCVIWVDSMGKYRNVAHNVPRVKLEEDGYGISVSIDPNPKILVKSANIPHSVMKDFKKGIKYIGLNYDLFLKHYLDEDFSYSDSDLILDLKKRS